MKKGNWISLLAVYSSTKGNMIRFMYFQNLYSHSNVNPPYKLMIFFFTSEMTTHYTLECRPKSAQYFIFLLRYFSHINNTNMYLDY